LPRSWRDLVLQFRRFLPGVDDEAHVAVVVLQRLGVDPEIMSVWNKPDLIRGFPRPAVSATGEIDRLEAESGAGPREGSWSYGGPYAGCAIIPRRAPSGARWE
jgi:hypothetical protein